MSTDRIIRELNREQSIKRRKVREYFTPSTPIDTSKHFKGRGEEVTRCMRALRTRGEHIIIYGERGVGKSSLAIVTCEEIVREMSEFRLVKWFCDTDEDFHSMWTHIMRTLGADLPETTRTVEEERDLEGAIDLKIARGGASAKTRTTSNYNIGSGRIVPSVVARFLHDKRVLIMIDEVDRLKDAEDRRRMAETLKHLSDLGSPATVVLVGIADVADELTAGHQSSSRCVRQIHLQRMADEEIRTIIVEGAEATGIRFDKEVVAKIIEFSAGYPHFAHLLALKCAEQAIATASDYVDKYVLHKAVSEAVDDTEQFLTNIYETAVHSNRTAMYRKVVHAAANLPGGSFSAAELREAVGKSAGRKIRQQSLNYYFGRLANGPEAIFTRIREGIYRFTDPRMPSFVRIRDFADVNKT